MLSTVQTETTNARKGRTSAKKGMISTSFSRSSKLSRASEAGGQERRGNQGVPAASTNSRKGASGQIGVVTHEDGATRKVARKGRTAATVLTATMNPSPQSTTNSKVGQLAIAIQGRRADLASPTPDVAASPSPPSIGLAPQHRDTIANINVNWRFRQGIVKAMTKLSLQAQACLRVGGSKEEAAKHYAVVAKDPTHADYIKIMPYLEAQQPLAKHRADYEKMLVKDVKTLPIYQWAKGVSGLGEVSLAGIIGECSGVNLETGEFWSIGDMKSVSAVWKRMGLAVINGGRQRRVTGDEALEHGYVATRRAVMWNIGECIVKAQWRKENTVHAYGKMYGALKAAMQERNEAGEYSDAALDIAARMKKTGKPLAENVAGRLTPSHINNRAKRHMTKRLLRDLYVEWHRLESGLNTAPKLA